MGQKHNKETQTAPEEWIYNLNKWQKSLTMQKKDALEAG